MCQIQFLEQSRVAGSQMRVSRVDVIRRKFFNTDFKEKRLEIDTRE